MSNKSLFSRLRGLSEQTTGAKKAGGSTSNREIIEKLQKEEDAFRNKVITSVRIDREFAREDDIDLTEEEKQQIKEYWSKYSFAYPNIDYESFKTFKNRYGHMDVRHCPGSIRTSFFHKHFVNRSYSVAYQNKALLGRLFEGIAQPTTVVRRINGYYFDENYRHITEQEAINICSQWIQKGEELIVKPNASSGGHNINFITHGDGETEIKAIFSKMGISAFVAQVVLHQSAFMSQFNESSVNTIRINTLLHKGEAIPLSAIIRVGSSGVRVDNYCSGGSLIGINIETGMCNDWAMANDHSNHAVLPNGLDLRDRQTIPNFDKVKELVIKAHWMIPYIKMISWDIALDENDMPLMIECNFAGMIQMNEAVSGPMFGPVMDELLDEYLIQKFFVKFATEDFICREYSDHVEIDEYIGLTPLTEIPEKLRDKKVTKIRATTFKNKIEEVSARADSVKVPSSLKKQFAAALKK